MRVRPYTLPGAALRAHLRDRLEQQVETWSSRWGVAAALDGVDACVPASFDTEALRAAPALRFEAADAGHWLVLRASDDALSTVGAAALARSFPPAAGNEASPLLRELGIELWRDLAATLAGDDGDYAPRASGRLAQCVRTEVWLQDSRCVRIDLNLAAVEFACWLPWALAEDRVASKVDAALAAAATQPLAARFAALGPERVGARALLGDAEVSLDALSSLRVGDVICLDAALDEPVELAFAGSEGRVVGHLGKRDDRLAIVVDRFVTG